MILWVRREDERLVLVEARVGAERWRRDGHLRSVYSMKMGLLEEVKRVMRRHALEYPQGLMKVGPKQYGLKILSGAK